MALADLLLRPGLDANLRLLVAAAAAIWRADWPTLQLAARLGRERGQPRQDFEETLLQAVLFYGFPRVITAFEQLAEAWPSERPPTGGALPEGERERAGRELFAAIYGKNDEAVRELLRGYHQELHDFVLSAAYGRILTRPHLSGRDREVVAVAVLATQGQVRQFAGHARGARHLGATDEQLREALVTVFGDGEAHARELDGWLGRLRT